MKPKLNTPEESAERTKFRQKVERATRGLSVKHRLYIRGVVLGGKTKMQAALDAGYSDSTARTASSHIEMTLDVREAFEKIMQDKIHMEEIADKIKQGMSASKFVTATDKGIITDVLEMPDHAEQRRYTELAAQYGGYHTPKQEIGFDGPSAADMKVIAALAQRMLFGVDVEIEDREQPDYQVIEGNHD